MFVFVLVVYICLIVDIDVIVMFDVVGMFVVVLIVVVSFVCDCVLLFGWCVWLFVVVLVCVYMLFGVFGYDLWK